jgi:hypothetical protein
MCNCKHHWVVKIVTIFAWLMALGFLWAGWIGDGTFMGRGMEELFQHVVVLALVVFTFSGCKCCCEKVCCGTCSK